MTWSAGINEIVSKYESRSELSDNTVFGLNDGCDTITRPAGTPIFVDAINGSAAWSGTVNCPKNSLSEAVVDATSGDEIILQSGNYHDSVTVDNLDDLLIRAADGLTWYLMVLAVLQMTLPPHGLQRMVTGFKKLICQRQAGNYSTIMMSKYPLVGQTPSSLMKRYSIAPTGLRVH